MRSRCDGSDLPTPLPPPLQDEENHSRHRSVVQLNHVRNVAGPFFMRPFFIKTSSLVFVSRANRVIGHLAFPLWQQVAALSLQ